MVPVVVPVVAVPPVAGHDNFMSGDGAPVGETFLPHAPQAAPLFCALPSIGHQSLQGMPLYWVVHDSPVPHLPSELVYEHTVIAFMPAFATHAVFCEFGSDPDCGQEAHAFMSAAVLTLPSAHAAHAVFAVSGSWPAGHDVTGVPANTQLTESPVPVVHSPSFCVSEHTYPLRHRQWSPNTH